MAQKLKAMKQTHFEHANKLGRWLAYKLKKDKEKRAIVQLQDEEANIHHRLDEKFLHIFFGFKL